jgi:PAS domain-containing protein
VRELAATGEREKSAMAKPGETDLLAAPAGSATWEWDLDTGIERYSAASAGLVLGSESSGRMDRATWMAHILPEDQRCVADSVERSLAQGAQRWLLSYRVRGRDGAVRRLRDRGFIVRIDGRPTRVLGDLSDEDGNRSEDANDDMHRLAGREQLYRAIVDFIPQMCWAADATGWPRGSRRCSPPRPCP